MSSPIVTPGSVTSAADAIVALGEKPTVDRIRAYLQGGSPNKILPLLREWKAANQQPRTDTGAEQPHIAAPEPVREIVTLETLPEVTGAIEALTHAILDVLSRVQSSERARADDKVQTLQEATTRQIQAERARATAIADEIQTAVTAQIVEAQQSETEMADLLERALEENEQLRAQLDQLRVEHEQTSGWLRTETAKTTSQETSLRNIQVERDQLKADLEASRGRVRELTDDRTDLSKRLADVARERDKTQSEAQQVGADLAAARQRIELLHGQLTDACTAQARAEAQRDAATERLADTRTERDAALERLTLPRKVF